MSEWVKQNSIDLKQAYGLGIELTPSDLLAPAIYSNGTWSKQRDNDMGGWIYWNSTNAPFIILDTQQLPTYLEWLTQ